MFLIGASASLFISFLCDSHYISSYIYVTVRAQIPIVSQILICLTKKVKSKHILEKSMFYVL